MHNFHVPLLYDWTILDLNWFYKLKSSDDLTKYVLFSDLNVSLWSKITFFVKTIRKIVRNNSAIRQSGLNFKWHFFLFRRLKIALYPINYAEIPWVVVKSRIFNSYSNVFSYRSFAIENSTKNLFKAAYALRRGLYPWVPYPSVPLIGRPKGYPTL